MSMSISRISTNAVPSMLSPVSKPSRLAKLGTGRTPTASTATPQAAVQGASPQPQPINTSSTTAEQAHAAFQYALAELQGSIGTTGDNTVAQTSPDQGQYAGVQQPGTAYAQVEQQAAGQVLDITA
jgi:hypothetical protein